MRTVTKTMGFGIALTGVLSASFVFSQTSAPPPDASSPNHSTPLAEQATGAAVSPVNAEAHTELTRGAYLVKLGDCVACHTQKDGVPFAGGRPLETPFGTILSANLTPDNETGIGRYTPDTFYRAMHEGLDKDGRHLYPAFPYNYYTLMPRADTDAMLVYLKSLEPVSHPLERNQLPFPFKIRGLMMFWNWLFLDEGPYQPNTAKSAEWNRGAYLVEGLGHCQACHTAKNILGAAKSSEAFRGGLIGDWYAPDITTNQRVGIGAWTADDLREFFREGRNVHSAASGEMGEAVKFSTSQMTDADLGAMLTYLHDLTPSPARKVAEPDQAVMRQGQAIWADQCAACHRTDATGVPRYFPPLQANAMLQQDNPTTIVHYILAGASKVATQRAPTQMSMPAFDWKLDDQQVAAVATYARNSWGNAASPVKAEQVAKLRNNAPTIAQGSRDPSPASMTKPGPGTLAPAGTSSTDNGSPQAGRQSEQ